MLLNKKYPGLFLVNASIVLILTIIAWSGAIIGNYCIKIDDAKNLSKIGKLKYFLNINLPIRVHIITTSELSLYCFF